MAGFDVDPEESEQFRSIVLARSFKAPMLPADATGLLALATNPDASLRELETAIRQDPMLAGRVLSLANSAAYARNAKISSLWQAAMRLGVDKLRDVLAQAVAEAYIFRGRKSRIEEVQRHSVAVAHLARQACLFLNIDPEMAFLCGLLHDVGHPILIQMVDAGTLPQITKSKPRALFEFLHPIVGERVIRSWGLPSVVAEVARFHHLPVCGVEGRTREINKVIAGVDRLAYHVNLGGKKPSVEFDEDPRWDEVGFPLRSAHQLRECAENLDLS